MWTLAVGVALSLIGVLTAQPQSRILKCPFPVPCDPGYRCEVTSLQCTLPPPAPCPEPLTQCVRINESCMEPVTSGPCEAAIPRYFYNATSEQCERFTWGGCKENGNNFLTLEDCRTACLAGRGNSCLYEGRWYPDGAVVRNNPCSPCNCSKGFLACLIIDCFFPPPCRDPVRLPGQCCPWCPTDTKPGECPRPRRGICGATCQNDTSCPKAEKCCPTGCGGRSCQPPAATCRNVVCPRGTFCRVMPPVSCVNSSCPSLPQCIKSGLCPAVPSTLDRPLPAARCPALCTSDTECPGEQRCCKGLGEGRPACGTSCQDPIFV